MSGTGGPLADALASLGAAIERRDAPTIVVKPLANAAIRRVHSSACYQHRQGDEMTCTCGKRWPVGEFHP